MELINPISLNRTALPLIWSAPNRVGKKFLFWEV